MEEYREIEYLLVFTHVLINIHGANLHNVLHKLAYFFMVTFKVPSFLGVYQKHVGRKRFELIFIVCRGIS